MIAEEKRYGHQRFYELTAEEEELHAKKNKDYANLGNPLRNFRSVGSIAKGLLTPGNEDVKVAIIYMLKQLDAAMNLISEGREGNIEGVLDRLKDVSVYSKLAMVLYEEGKMRIEQNIEGVDFFYLAHPLDDREGIREWEVKFEKESKYKLFNPFYDVTRKDITEIDEGKREKYNVDPDFIVNRDLYALRNCRGLVAFITGTVSYGTIQEIVYAKIFQKPVYLIVTNKHESHPWLKYHATKIFTTKEEFEKFIGVKKE